MANGGAEVKTRHLTETRERHQEAVTRGGKNKIKEVEIRMWRENKRLQLNNTAQMGL